VLLPVALGDPLDAARYGGKAASLSTALAAGLPVPPGFALAADDVAALADREVDTAPLELALDELGGPAVAVRSSAVGEDSAGASFAGQHVSVLNVSGVAQVQAAIERVAASGRSDAALAYRRRMDIEGAPQVAVVVQRLVPADVAGVLFTRDPVTGSSDRWVVEASWGLGETVVAGLVTPDHVVMTPGGEVVEQVVGDKSTAVVADPAGGTQQRPHEGDSRALCVDRATLGRLAALGVACERLFGAGQDIEWAVAGGALFLLQARPVTTGPGRRPNP
jgi:pyruvate,water dikinase